MAGKFDGVMDKTLDCDIKTIELKLQSDYYVLFRTNALEKGMNPVNHP